MTLTIRSKRRKMPQAHDTEWAVFRGNERIGAWTKKWAAEAALEAAQEEPGHSDRPCMCCRQDFPSDGPHNRLCKTCSRHGIDTSTYAIGRL